MKNFQDLTVSDYLLIARRRIWYVIVPAVLVSIGSAVFIWRMPSVYKSETTILVSDRIVPEDYIGSLVRQSVLDRIEFAKQQIRSRTFIERIAQEFQLGGNGGSDDAVVTAVLNNTEMTVVPPNEFKIGFYSSDPNTAQAVTRRLAERVTQTNTTFRQEKVNSADQFLDEQARQAADDLAQAEQKLREFNDRRFPGVPDGITPETLSLLQSQLATADADLQTALEQRKAYEKSLAEHRDLKLAAKSDVPTSRVPAGPAVPVAAPPSQLELELTARKNELKALLTRYRPDYPDVRRLERQVHDLESQIASTPPPKNPSVLPTPAANQQSQVEPLPEVDFTVDFYEAEVRRELDLLNRDIAKRENSRKDLANKIAGYSRRVNMPPDVMQERDTLTQNVQAARERYSILSSKKLSSDLAGKVDTDANNKTFVTIDPANLPQLPVRPDRRTLTAVGCLAGLGLGIGLALAREILDPTVSNQDSAAAELKVPILTSIPIIGSGKRHERKLAKKRKKESSAARRRYLHTLQLEQPDTEKGASFSIQACDSQIRDVISGHSTVASEQFQMMRAELSVQKQKGLRSFIVTSTVPNEGKTFIACCLAAILGKEKGKKVLLIDGDLRTGSAGQVMGIENGSLRKGLSNVLSGEADIEDCLISCADLNLSFLPAGRVVENPVELLSSPRLEQVMRDLTLFFDWIIVDSPPVLPIADTMVFNPVCDASIMVVRADRTPVSLIKDAINKVGRTRVTGVVLNGVHDIKASHYYAHYYHQLEQAQK